MDSRDKLVLEKILAHIDLVLGYCQDCAALQDFQDDSMRVDATVFNLMQIGELAKNALSDEVKLRFTAIPWPQLYGMRNRVVHGYSGINLRIVWDTVSLDLPRLREELHAALSAEV